MYFTWSKRCLNWCKGSYSAHALCLPRTHIPRKCGSAFKGLHLNSTTSKLWNSQDEFQLWCPSSDAISSHIKPLSTSNITESLSHLTMHGDDQGQTPFPCDISMPQMNPQICTQKPASYLCFLPLWLEARGLESPKRTEIKPPSKLRGFLPTFNPTLTTASSFSWTAQIIQQRFSVMKLLLFIRPQRISKGIWMPLNCARMAYMIHLERLSLSLTLGNLWWMLQPAPSRSTWVHSMLYILITIADRCQIIISSHHCISLTLLHRWLLSLVSFAPPSWT